MGGREGGREGGRREGVREGDEGPNFQLKAAASSKLSSDIRKDACSTRSTRLTRVFIF